jgi:type IV pilus assembly protein PilC
MGYFPTRVAATDPAEATVKRKGYAQTARGWGWGRTFFTRRVKAKALTEFTRQLVTVVDSGIPLVRGLRLLEEQEENKALKRIFGELVESIEGGCTFSEALARHPKTFNRLYENMVRAGELGGVLEVVLDRLAQFMEKAQKIQGKVVAAMFYPVSVLLVAMAILAVMMLYVVPQFKSVFSGLMPGSSLPGFTLLVLNLSEVMKDRFKFSLPVIGKVIKKAAISRFTRTLGTLVSSGVPILQALTIVKETAGNAVLEEAIASVHASVKEGETITVPLRASRVFPAVVIGMIDVGEQTGALPEMLQRIADNYEEEVDNAVSAMTALLEPIMIVILAVVVGSIVIAMYLPILKIVTDFDNPNKKTDV